MVVFYTLATHEQNLDSMRRVWLWSRNGVFKTCTWIPHVSKRMQKSSSPRCVSHSTFFGSSTNWQLRFHSNVHASSLSTWSGNMATTITFIWTVGHLDMKNAGLRFMTTFSKRCMFHSRDTILTWTQIQSTKNTWPQIHQPLDFIPAIGIRIAESTNMA